MLRPYIVENDERAIDTTNGVVLQPWLDRWHAVIHSCGMAKEELRGKSR